MPFIKDRLEKIKSNLYIDKALRNFQTNDHTHTKEAFSEKWEKLDQTKEDNEPWQLFQLDWQLSLYGFKSERDLKDYLKKFQENSIFLDAGCGKGYKSSWLTGLSNDAKLIGADFSSSVVNCSERYKDNRNIDFLQADLANLPIEDGSLDLIFCDQVLHHTQDPQKTLFEFARIMKKDSVLFTYVYKKKALPREILDEYFRSACKEYNKEEIWEISKGMTQIGRLLSENDIELDFPEIKPLGIKGGKQSLQRFLYWNFFKCFWNENFGYEASLSTNFDWYSPSIAFRYSEEEFLNMLHKAGFQVEYLHEEEACLSGRFRKISF